MTDNTELHDEAPPRSWAGPGRIAAGLAQGIVLYLLWEANKNKLWPFTAPMLNAALFAVAVYTPLVKIEGMARLRLADGCYGVCQRCGEVTPSCASARSIDRREAACAWRNRYAR